MRNFLFVLMIICSMPLFAEKIATVDMKKVWDNVDEIKKEKGNMESMLKKSQTAIDAKKEELTKMEASMKQELSMASEEAKKAMYQEYQTKLMEFQKMYQEHQKNLQNKDLAVQASFVDKVKLIVVKIAKSKGYSMVLPKDNLLYSDDKDDITFDVIKAYNNK